MDQGKMEEELARLGAKIDQLMANAKGSKEELARKVEEFRAQHKLTRERLETLKGTGSEALKEVKTGVEKAWGELSKALENALAKFK